MTKWFNAITEAQAYIKEHGGYIVTGIFPIPVNPIICADCEHLIDMCENKNGTIFLACRKGHTILKGSCIDRKSGS